VESFAMRRLAFMFVFLLCVGSSFVHTAAAQDIEGMQDDSVLKELDYPVLEIGVGPDGIDAPDEVTEGWYYVSFSAAEPYIGYLDFMIPPDGLDIETATQQAKDAGANDLALPDWEYLGGVNTFSVGESLSFVIYLQPGEIQVAASYYPIMDEQYDDSKEIMALKPMTVSPSNSDEVSPEVNAAPEAVVTLEMTDELTYIVTPDPIPAGPQLWKLTNTGTEHAHHVVMMQVPEGTTADDISGEFDTLMAGTPPAEDSVMMNSVPAGYAALQSGGHTTYQGYDLEPGTYAVICYILNHHTGAPHFVDGMITVFTVE
jgi:hypothetical protein